LKFQTNVTIIALFVDNSLLPAVIVLVVIAVVAIIAGMILLILYIKLRAAYKRLYCLCFYVVIRRRRANSNGRLVYCFFAKLAAIKEDFASFGKNNH